MNDNDAVRFVQEQLANYAACVFEPTDIANLRFIHHVTDHVPNFFFTAAQLPRSAQLCLDHNQRGYSIYAGANPRTRKGGTKAEHVALARCLFAEWDGVSTDVARLSWERVGLPAPTLLLFSGAGPHSYWRFGEPLTDLDMWTELQKRLVAAVGSDNIHDRPRVMRLPGFINQKPDRGQTVQLLECDPSRRYDLAELAAVLPEMNCDNEICDFDDLPDIQKWEYEEAGNKTGLKPGQDFDARGEVDKVLLRNGWKLIETKPDDVTLWRRPGKDHGISASLKGRALYCFTTSTKLPSGKGLSPFAVLTYLEHNGDFSAAAKALAAEGFGTPFKSKKAAAMKPTLPEPFLPFPTDALPEPIRSFVVDGAKSIGCDASFIALPLLTVLGAAIGNSRRLLAKRGWTVPPILWTAIVGESGTAKTPAFKLALKAMRERQRKALQHQEEEERRYQGELAQYDKQYAEWKRSKNKEEDPPKKPEPPEAERCLVSDTTVEALAPILKRNPRGLCLARDELSGWLGSFDRYVGGKGGADASHWLSMYNGETIIVDRRTGQPRTIYVHLASMCVAGGIQPAILHKALGREHRESGLCARLLLACPPRKPKKWTEKGIDQLLEDKIARMLDWLYELHPAIDDDEKLQPVVIGMTRDAKAAWKAYYISHAEEANELTGELAAAFSKLEETACRLALIIHYARWAAGDESISETSPVDKQSMEAGITLCQWFKRETVRVYALLDESDEDREQRRVIEWIECRGGCTTARDLAHGPRRFRGQPDEAEAFLEGLVRADAGAWEFLTPSDQGGRPTRLFRLKSANPGPETPLNSSDSEGFGSGASSEEAIENPEKDDDQGEGEWTA